MTDTTPELSAEDRAVAQQLGIPTGDASTDQGGAPAGDAPEGEQGEDQGQESTAFEALPQSWQTEIHRLRREAAANRVKAKQAAQAPKAAEGEQETPDAIEKRVRESVRLEYGTRVASADVKASLKGVVPEALLDSVVSRLNIAEYVTDQGETDHDAVQALHDEYVTLLGSKKPAPRVGHSKQGTGAVSKSNADLFGEALFGSLS